MEKKFSIGFWNYLDTGKLDPVSAVKDWADLGMSLPMSFEYDPDLHDISHMNAVLDECLKHNMRVIVCDRRTRWHNLTALGRVAFEKEVRAAIRDFGSHKAVLGFHIGDEPNSKQIDDMIAAYRIVKSAAPKLYPFVNFFPFWDEPDFDEVLGVKGAEGYEELLSRIVKEAGLEMLCYDYYGQCAYFEKERYTNLYFRNLNLFGRVARKHNIPLWTSLLSVGHWSLRCPTEDDIRYQTSTAIAYGASCLMWFFVYERKLDSSYRVPPIDLFWKKTETYDWLSRQNKTVLQYYAHKLHDIQLDNVRCIGKGFADTVPFSIGEFEILKLDRIINEDAPIIISRFFRSDGGITYIIVNADKAQPVRLQLGFRPEVSFKNDSSDGSGWYAPGQMIIVELEKLN